MNLNHLPQTMKRNITAILYVFVFGMLSPEATFANNSFTISPSVLNFNYIEFDTNGDQLDKETGPIPGISLSMIGSDNSGLKLKAGLSVYSATIKYDGQTQTGIPLTTNTQETLRNLNFSIGKTLLTDEFPLDIFFNLELKSWDRDIQSKNNVSGLYEKYEWDQIGAGLIHTLINNNNHRLTFNLDVFRVYSPKITVDLSGFGFGTPKLSLKQKTGFRTGLDWRTINRERYDYGFSIYYEQYGFGASDTEILTDPNNNQITILEPRSETRQVVLQISMHHPF